MAHMEGSTLQDPWDAEDMMALAYDSQGVLITNEDALLVLERAADCFDANIGLNWEVFEYHLDSLIIEGQIKPKEIT